MDQFNFSISEGLRYSHSPASTPRLIETPSDRVQSMHLMPTDQSTHNELDTELRTFDLFDETSEEVELELQMGAMRAASPHSLGPSKLPDKPHNHNDGGPLTAYISQCFHEAQLPLPASPSSVYTTQQTSPNRSESTNEVGCHDPDHRPNTASSLYAASPLRQVFRPVTASSELPTTNALKSTYRLTRTTHHPPRKDSLPSMFQNKQSFMRYSNDHAPPPPTPRKRVSPPPPPIDISGSRTYLPDTISRASECPTYGGKNSDRRQNDNSTSTMFDKEYIIPLTLRRHAGYTRRSRTRRMIVTPTQPSNANTKPVPAPKQKHIGVWDYDDALFFSELKYEYGNLAGPFCHFSARSLQTMKPIYSSSAELDIECGWDKEFSEQEMMTIFRSPRRGEGQYAWVQWAHCLSSQTSQNNVSRDLVANDEENPEECVIGLAFIQGWSAWRILLALVVVILLAICATLLWILLGTRVEPDAVQIQIDKSNVSGVLGSDKEVSGFHHAGERVVGGMLAGIFTLLVGWTGIIGWVVVSWLVE